VRAERTSAAPSTCLRRYIGLAAAVLSVFGLACDARAQNAAAPGIVENGVLRIDLAAALRLADERNLDVAIYLARVAAASARLRQARSLAVPTLRVGSSYNRHTGPLQETGGAVTESDGTSRLVGLGAGAVGAGDPRLPGLALDVDVADAIFQPLVAKQDRAAAEAAADANGHAVLLDVATAYFEWLEARAEDRIAGAIVQRARDLEALTHNYAEAGEGLRADAELAAVQPLLWQQRRLAAETRTETSEAALSQLLHLDTDVRLQPVEEQIPVVEIYSANEDLAQLVERALRDRPETDQAAALVAAAQGSVRAERYGLFIPRVSLGYSAGEFGGAPGSSVADTAHRDDLTLLLYWQFDHLGLGNRARGDEKRAELRQRELERDKLHDAITAEVREDYARVQSLRRQMQLAQEAAKQAQNAYDLQRQRIFDRQGLPLEALQAMQTLSEAELAQAQATVGYSLAQIRLHTALGNPVDAGALARRSTQGP
jgi:outer membrane protein TolC